MASPLTTMRDRFPSELLINLTLRELRGKYKRSFLGWGWSVINPITQLVIYTFVFSRFLRIDPRVGDPSGLNNYALFLMTGLLPWTYLTNTISGAASSLTGNESLIKKVYFPRAALPGAIMLSHLAGFCFEYAVLAAFLVLAGNMIFLSIPAVLVVMALQTVFLLGLGLMIAVANVYFRDTSHLVAVGLNAWFFATPILYPLALVPDNWRWFMSANPMYHFVTAFRDLLYDLRGPTLIDWATLFALAAVSLALGGAMFRRFEPRLAEEL